MLRLTRPLIVFDIESTGLDPRRDRIIELAAVRVNPDGTEETRRWLLNPTVSIPAETTAIHGYHDSDVRDCPTFIARVDEIEAFFAGCDLGGFNEDRFDIPILETEFERAGRDFGSAQRKHVDVQRIYHRKEPRDLSAAVRFYLGRDHVGAHGALADATATLEVLKAQLEHYPDLPQDVDALDEYLVPRDPMNADRNGMIRWFDGAWRINFGRNKGRALLDIRKEDNFMRWIINGKFNADVRQIIQNLRDYGIVPPMPAGARV